MQASWDRQAGETAEWYDCFTLYLYMGPKRTVNAVHDLVTRVAQGAARSQRRSWQRAAARHHWQERAGAFDAAMNRQALAGHEQLQMVAALLQQVYGVLQRAELPDLSKEEARELLPQLRHFFRDLLRLHQSAVAHALAAEKQSSSEAMIHADDLLAMMAEGDSWQQVIEEMQRTLQLLQASTGKQADRQTGRTALDAGLDAGLGAALDTEQATVRAERWQPLRDVLAQLYPDETSARRIAAQAQLDVARIRFSPRAVDSWHAILTEAAHAGQMEGVIDATQQEYGANPELARAVRQFRQTRATAKPQRARRKG